MEDPLDLFSDPAAQRLCFSPTRLASTANQDECCSFPSCSRYYQDFYTESDQAAGNHDAFR